MSWNKKTIPFKMTGSSNQLLMYNPHPLIPVFFFPLVQVWSPDRLCVTDTVKCLFLLIRK